MNVKIYYPQRDASVIRQNTRAELSMQRARVCVIFKPESVRLT